MKNDRISNNIDEIRSRLTLSALLEQAAEESAELTQAFLKKARKLRGENPTPKTLDEIDAELREEFADLALCAEALGMKIDMKILEKKLDRWIERTKVENR